MKQAISLSNPKSTPGYDDIHINWITKTPDLFKYTPLHIYNHIWAHHKIPRSWKIAIVNPILKPGQPSNNIKSYRPNLNVNNTRKNPGTTDFK